MKLEHLMLKCRESSKVQLPLLYGQMQSFCERNRAVMQELKADWKGVNEKNDLKVCG